MENETLCCRMKCHNLILSFIFTVHVTVLFHVFNINSYDVFLPFKKGDLKEVEEGFVFLIKNKADFFGSHTLIALIVWNTNVKSNRASKWLKVLAPEPIGEVWCLLQALMQVFTFKRRQLLKQ